MVIPKVQQKLLSEILRKLGRPFQSLTKQEWMDAQCIWCWKVEANRLPDPPDSPPDRDHLDVVVNVVDALLDVAEAVEETKEEDVVVTGAGAGVVVDARRNHLSNSKIWTLRWTLIKMLALQMLKKIKDFRANIVSSTLRGMLPMKTNVDSSDMDVSAAPFDCASPIRLNGE